MNKLYLLVLVLLTSCAGPSYYHSQQPMLDKFYQGKYEEAISLLDKTTSLSKPYNENLRDIEKGRILFLMKKYEEAAKQLILAETRQEDWSTIHYTDINGYSTYLQDKRFTKDRSPLPPPPANHEEMMDQGANGVRGSYGQVTNFTFKSPMKTNYVCYDFERPLINFYVGLCGAMLKDDKPLIEAKRLQLLMDQLDLRKFPIHPGNINYSTNPFIPMVIGTFYEYMGEPSNALISYKKAFEAYESKYCFLNYGVRTPSYLLNDIFYLTQKLGFNDQLEQLEKKYPKTKNTKSSKEDFLFLFVEEGYVPVKEKVLGFYTHGNLPQSTPQNIPGEIMGTYVSSVQPIQSSYNLALFVGDQLWEGALISNPQYIMLEPMNKRFLHESGFLINELGNANKSSTKNPNTRSWQTLPGRIHCFKIPIDNSKKNLKVTYTDRFGASKSLEVEQPLERGLAIKYMYLE